MYLMFNSKMSESEKEAVYQAMKKKQDLLMRYSPENLYKKTTDEILKFFEETHLDKPLPQEKETRQVFFDF